MRIGIDIGGMSVKGGIVSNDGVILHKHVIKTKPGDVSKSIASDLASLIDLLLVNANVKASDITACGIGSPGAIDPINGVIKYSNNIVMKNVRIRGELSKLYPFPVSVDNDANCAALGEAKFGGGRGAEDVIFITLGTGVGSGIIVGGKLFTGGGGAGAEAGHTVIKVGGEKCNCGRRGCWERYASATALVRQTKAAMLKNPGSAMHAEAARDNKVSGRTAFLAAARGDKAGQKVVDTYLNYIAAGILNLANVFRPQLAVIGGGVSNEGPALLAPIQARLDKELFGGEINPPVKVVLAKLGNDAGILGAAFL